MVSLHPCPTCGGPIENVPASEMKLAIFAAEHPQGDVWEDDDVVVFFFLYFKRDRGRVLLLRNFWLSLFYLLSCHVSHLFGS